MLLERTRRDLRPGDFAAQLYICVTEGMLELTSRRPVVYGQSEILLPVTDAGEPNYCLIFDREHGGDHVLAGAIRFRSGPPRTKLGDKINVYNMRWP
jgi:hypothetical protein